MVTMMNDTECYELLESMDEDEAFYFAIKAGAQSVGYQSWGLTFHDEDNVIFMIWKP